MELYLQSFYCYLLTYKRMIFTVSNYSVASDSVAISAQ